MSGRIREENRKEGEDRREKGGGGDEEKKEEKGMKYKEEDVEVEMLGTPTQVQRALTSTQFILKQEKQKTPEYTRDVLQLFGRSFCGVKCISV